MDQKSATILAAAIAFAAVLYFLVNLHRAAPMQGAAIIYNTVTGSAAALCHANGGCD